MHVLDADVITVGVTQHVDDVAKRRTLYATETTGIKLTIQIPDREVVVCWIKFWIVIRLVSERIDAREDMSTHTVCVDHLNNATFLIDHFGLILLMEWVNALLNRPTQWLEWDIKSSIQLIVEPVLAEQQLMNVLEEFSRLSALNNAVIVRRCDGNNLRYSERCEHVRHHSLKLCRILDCASRYDCSLSVHQAWYRHSGADSTWIGERDVCA